jgi:hypothetical protein
MPANAAALVRHATRRGLVTCSLLILGCASPDTPPAASFLVVAGDSTFWVERSEGRLRMRASPLFLAKLGRDFSELYVADDDRSYHDALIVGQRIYRRDLVRGDSVLLREDTTIAGIAAAWARANPDDVPLGPDEDTVDDPSTVATTETELLDVVGPYLTFEYHLDVDVGGYKDQHLTQRGVVDVRTGRPVRVEDLVGLPAASRIYAEASSALAAAIDSIRRARDERAMRARSTIGGFHFDSTSFELLEGDAAPEVAFLVPGRGPTAGGYALPLPAMPLPPAPWWSELRATRPTLADDAGLTWAAESYDIIARPDSLGERAVLSVRRGVASWPVAHVPQPVRRVYRLDAPNDSVTRQALARAFDDAAGYSGESRTAARTPHVTTRLASASPWRRFPRDAGPRWSPGHESVNYQAPSSRPFPCPPASQSKWPTERCRS